MIKRQPLQFFEKQNTLELILIYDLFPIPGGTDIFGKCLEKHQEKREDFFFQKFNYFLSTQDPICIEKKNILDT